MSIKERILKFISNNNIPVSEFERRCGLSNGYVSSMRKGFGTGKLDNVLNEFAELNRDWLLYGEGEMLKGDTATPIVNYTKGVPYYDVDFLGGFGLLFNDKTVTPEYLIDFKGYNDSTCWCNVTGHSMEPEITNGDMIALKLVEDHSFLPFGEIYAIITTNNMRTIKRIGPATSPDKYSLIPTNKSPEFGIQEIPKNMIQKVFQVLGCMKKL